jgi:hypothetical protein
VKTGLRGVVGGAILGAFFFPARDARAVEHQHELAVDVGTGVLAISDATPPTPVGRTDVGPSFGIHYGYGITDMFNLAVEVHYTVLELGFPPPSPAGSAPTPGSSTVLPATMWNADIGLQYVVDVMRWVPYLGALAGGYWMQGGTIGSYLQPGAEIAIGLDYLVTPKWAIGFEGAEHFLFLNMNLYTSYTTAFVRTMFLFGK